MIFILSSNHCICRLILVKFYFETQKCHCIIYWKASICLLSYLNHSKSPIDEPYRSKSPIDDWRLVSSPLHLSCMTTRSGTKYCTMQSEDPWFDAINKWFVASIIDSLNMIKWLPTWRWIMSSLKRSCSCIHEWMNVSYIFNLTEATYTFYSYGKNI